MIATWCVLMTTAAVLIAVQAGQNNHYFAISPNKDSRCHVPKITGCNASLYPIMDYQVAAWFFHPPFKSCRPLYTAGGVHNCPFNTNLPVSKEMCERICAEPCTMDDGSQGICMLDEYCKIKPNKSSAHPRPCQVYNVKCCPKSYVVGIGTSDLSSVNTIGGNIHPIINRPQYQTQLGRKKTVEVNIDGAGNMLNTTEYEIMQAAMGLLPTEAVSEGNGHRTKRTLLFCRHFPAKCAYHRRRFVAKLLRKIGHLMTFDGTNNNEDFDDYLTGYRRDYPKHYNVNAAVQEQGYTAEYQKENPREYYNGDPKEYPMEQPKGFYLKEYQSSYPGPHHQEYPNGPQVADIRKEHHTHGLHKIHYV
ncbi:uncharacterized protein LOC126844461 [Adelges cooleyi]|uniref:uncharacterized protein LOC126844461 n=1 Tax=Adelges cooleyi TaxID=133065 RepID=UPI00217F9B98|nr:uncharacterized protein LOC126844461 [Adelges cooleyi]